MVLLSFPEQVIDEFMIPAFTIKEGEIVIIQIPGGNKFYGLTQKLISIIIKQNSRFKYVEHIKISSFLNFVFPMTIEKYLKDCGPNEIYQNKIYEENWIKPNTKVNTLPGSARRRISLYKTMTFTKNIILDLVGVDPKGAIEIYGVLKNNKKNNGATILFDNYNEFKNDCTKFIVAKYIGH